MRYPLRAGVALETGHFPDSPNQPHFPRTTLLPDQTFRSRTVFRILGRLSDRLSWRRSVTRKVISDERQVLHCNRSGAARGSGTRRRRGAGADAPNFAGAALTAPRSDWPTNGGDWYNRRYSPLQEINRDTVQRLKGVWRVRLNGSGFGPRYSAEAQPIFFDGVLYVATAANDIFAIDVDTGDFLWTYEANSSPTSRRSAAAGPIAV